MQNHKYGRTRSILFMAASTFGVLIGMGIVGFCIERFDIQPAKQGVVTSWGGALEPCSGCHHHE